MARALIYLLAGMLAVGALGCDEDLGSPTRESAQEDFDETLPVAGQAVLRLSGVNGEMILRRARRRLARESSCSSSVLIGSFRSRPIATSLFL